MGELLGKQLLPREFVDVCQRHGWKSYDLVLITSVVFAESQGFIGAYNDNLDSSNQVTSRDCGVLEISIPASEIGTDVEFLYRTTSLDQEVYGKVVENSAKRAWELFNQSWTRNSNPTIRRFQPWFGYTKGWATFPKAWIWHQDSNHNPVGPWNKTGRYLHKAIAGVANWHHLVKGDKTIDEALVYANSLALHFKLDSTMTKDTKKNVIRFVPPKQPVDPPKDGVGPRPVPNDGA